MTAPFPYFGGKRAIADDVWQRLGRPTQYIEPFCGGAAMLLHAPAVASLEVINDYNGFVANFWRAVKHQPAAVAEWADYPVSHIDLGARHRWLMEQRDRLGAALHDPAWPGDAQVAGWWLWGQCAWIGSGCVAGVRDVQALGQVPHASDAGMGVLLTSGGRTAWRWLHALADRLERVRVVHGEWSRCLNHYGGADTAVFLDPPYDGFEGLYRAESVAQAVAAWCQAHGHLRVALCGHVGDYDLPGWDVQRWDRGRFTYGGHQTTAQECVWYSPGCQTPQPPLFRSDEEVA